MSMGFFTQGWAVFPDDSVLGEWLTHAVPAAKTAVANLAHSNWLRCGGTWFAGVNVLPNDATGTVGGSGPLTGQAVEFVRAHLGLTDIEWDRAQVSVIYPGYPRQGKGESDTAFRFRRDRDAAHVDGLLPVGPDRRRMIREPHGFVLGLPLTGADARASPMVVWEGSHKIMRHAFRDALKGHAPADWPNLDVTEAYRTGRRRAFRTCRRVVVHARPGQAYLVHRLALHGVAPWQDRAVVPPEGRMVAYFRPETGSMRDWLDRA